MQVTFFYPRPVDYTIDGYALKLEQIVLFGVVSWEGEQPDNSGSSDPRGPAPVLRVAGANATVTDSTGKVWDIPAGYYEVREVE